MKEQKIFLKLKKEPKTIESLIESLFSSKSGIIYSHVTRPIRKSVETFEDKECTILQCDENKYRSFEEIFIITKTYFPSVTIEEVLEALLNAYPNKKLYFYPVACYDIKKITCIYRDEIHSITQWWLNKENSKNSWSELFEKIGINSFEEFRKELEQRKKF